ncbi:ArsA family ATPase [Saliphagus sp. LR7]|uniref:ArsA family ATPase n=1 Tax=Saliphagus sp. LR7 TaxID=2282654 RepID=UPI000DF7B4DD|nr:ArsA family ATPase [Saliphagus sp. LR7]
MSGLDVEPTDERESAEPEDGDNTIEVTPTDSIDRETIDVEPAGEPVEGPSYVLYGGKGGVGKTTMAAATALDSAREGTATLVVSTDPAHSLSDTFETEVPSSPERIREEIPLWAAEIDPDAALEESQAAFAAEGGLGGLGDLLGEEGPMDALFGGAMPGADEAAAMQLLLEYMDDPRFDRVVVDTAPTGHTLRLLELPEIMDTMMGRMITFRERLGGMIDGVKGMFGGEAAEGEGADMAEMREVRERIERLRAVLQDPELTDFRIVMIPEEMSVVESKRLREQLDRFEIAVGTVVVNRVMEPLAEVTDDVSGEFLSPDLEDCEFCKRRWEVQQGALEEAQELFYGTDVRRVPLFAEDVRGETMLSVVAACLR